MSFIYWNPVEDIHSVVQPLRWRLYREVAIYDAYQRFWKYMESDERKNPSFVFDMLQTMNIILMVWEQDGSGQVQLQCPLVPDPHLLDALHSQTDIQVIYVIKRW